MNRKTDVSRVKNAPTGEPAETTTPAARCDAAVEQATALLIHSMKQSDSPISEIGGALARMSETLSTVGTPVFGESSGAVVGSAQSLRDALARDIAVCIQSLQFHDRLMQQLTQARDLLTGQATSGLLARLPNMAAFDGSIEGSGSVELF